MSILKTLRRRNKTTSPPPPVTGGTETTAYMNALSIPNDSTVYYAGTPQEKTGSQLWSIIEDYIIGLKTEGLWDKIGAEYPIIGGTQARHGINIKDPSLYVVSWFGSWVHNELGAKGDGVTTRAETGIIPADIGQVNGNNGISYLSGEDLAETNSDPTQIGVANSISQAAVIQGGRSGADKTFTTRFNSTLLEDLNNTSNSGFFTGMKHLVDTVSKQRAFKNGVFIKESNGGGTLPTVAYLFGAIRLGGSVYGNSVQRFQNASYHLFLTDTEMSAYYNLIETRETALGRKTW